jgi:lipoprotein-anchoring transpeptidase ErfK/SrfK
MSTTVHGVHVKKILFAIVLALAFVGMGRAPLATAASNLPVGDYARLTVHGIELRSGPSIQHAAKYKIDKGEIVKVLSTATGCLEASTCAGGWYQVQHRVTVGYLPSDVLAYTGLAGKQIAQRHTRVIVVSLARQQMEVYQSGRLIQITPVTTGKPATPTPLGTFKVFKKISPYVFRSPHQPGHPEYYSPSPVDMAMKFTTGGHYLHDAPWRPNGAYGYGTNTIHPDSDVRIRQGSHGCVNIPLEATKKLWAWVRLGDVVRVVAS